MKTELEAQEHLAFGLFVQYLETETKNGPVVVNSDDVRRGMDGLIIVPVKIQDRQPSATLAMHIGHKAEQLYKQTACRFLLAQQPAFDPERRTYIWTETGWTVLS